MSDLIRLNVVPSVQARSPSERCPRLPLRVLPLLVAACLPAAVPGFAAPPSWVPATPAGGTVTALAQAPSAPQILYAGTLTAGVFCSQDGGRTWASRAAALAPADLAIASLVVDPRDEDTVFAVPMSGDELVRSRDGGLTWDALRLGSPNLTYLTQVAFDEARPGALFAAADNGLYETQDDGDTWRLLAFGDSYVSSVAVDPRRPAVVLAAVWEDHSTAGKIWRSVDSGRTWRFTPLFADALIDLTADPTRAGTIYVLSDSTIYDSTDDGASWVKLPATIYANAFTPSPWGTLYASSGSGVVSSRDGGSTWSPDPSSPASNPSPHDRLWQLLVSSAHPRTLLAGGDSGLWRSEDGGASWRPASHGIFATSPTSVAVDAAGSVFCTFDRQVQRSRDRGRNWRMITTGLFDSVVADPLRPEVLYLFGDVLGGGRVPSLFVSHDSGRTWQEISPFISVSAGLEVSLFAVDPKFPDILYLSGTSFVGDGHDQEPYTAASSDGGKTWQVIAAELSSLTVLAFDSERTSTMYGVEEGDRLWRSSDGGQTWTRVGAGLPAPLPEVDRIMALAVDPTDPRIVYAGTGGHGVYRSTDRGRSFSPMNQGLRSAIVRSLIVDPRRPGLLVAAAATAAGIQEAAAGESGVFRWQAAANTWQALGDGLPVLAGARAGFGDMQLGFASPLALDGRADVLYAATPLGIYRLDAPDQP
jgi:photosystem II stability/assembly factor-like uncharacterized protein